MNPLVLFHLAALLLLGLGLYGITSRRSLVGMLVVIVGLSLTSDVLRGALLDSMRTVQSSWTTGLP